MSLLSDIKFFLKKYLKNPALIAGMAYLVYKMMTKNMKKEFFAESLQEIQDNALYSVIYDKTLQKYLLIDKTDLSIYSSPSKQDILDFIKKNYLEGEGQ